MRFSVPYQAWGAGTQDLILTVPSVNSDILDESLPLSEHRRHEAKVFLPTYSTVTLVCSEYYFIGMFSVVQ